MIQCWDAILSKVELSSVSAQFQFQPPPPDRHSHPYDTARWSEVSDNPAPHAAFRTVAVVIRHDQVSLFD